MVIDDNLLVERYRQGDRTAAQAIVQKHNQMLWRVARGIVRDDAEAEEALQNAYVRALTSLDGFRGESSLATWLSPCGDARPSIGPSTSPRWSRRWRRTIPARRRCRRRPAPRRSPRASRSDIWWKGPSTRCRRRSASCS
jgi:hypothetical protein